MQGLNSPQREAVRYLDGPLLVLAGAGSGKTRVITQKIAYLIGECGMAPQHVTAITFTNKAAKEMRERAGKLVGDRAEGLTISTFHALGAKMLRQEARHIGLKPGFSILDASDTTALFQELLRGADKARVRLIQQRISLWKNALLGPAEALAQAADDLDVGAAHVYQEYDRTLKAYQAVDFDDLIRLPVNLLEADEAAAQRWRSRIWHLLVDEYQDTNRCQNRLMRLLTGPRAAFTAVGDDDQSIYAWRGADIENLRLLKDEFPTLKVIKLEQNYRSTTRILKAANNVIRHNPKLFDKQLWSDKGHGDVIRVMACRDGEHEAEWVVTRLLAHKFETRGRWSDYAILYRGNHQARLFEQQLRAHKAPYVLSGGQSFFDRTEIKDVTSYLRLLANGNDDPAFIRAATTPKRGIGGTTLEALGHAAGRRQLSLFAAIFAPGIETEVKAPQLAALREFGSFIKRIESRAVGDPPPQTPLRGVLPPGGEVTLGAARRVSSEPAGTVLEELLRAIGYEAWLFETLEVKEAETRWSNVRDFVGWLATKAEAENKNLLELAQTIALITMLDKQDENHDAVQLATLHSAKGLEFRHVHLVGVEEGNLPHREAVDNGNIEEERRLMYVGITRAQMSLNISWCAKRKQGREYFERTLSRFIDEMDGGGSDDIKREGQGAVPPAPTFDKAAGNARLANFKALLKK